MTTDLHDVSPAVARTMETWHRMVTSGDLAELPTIVHPDAVFRSPMVFTPYTSRDALVLALSTAIQVFEDFTYHRQFAGTDGQDVVLEFSARVGDRQLKGIDMIHFDRDGLITEFEVMIRPFSGLQALGAEMGARVGALLQDYKQPR